MYLQIRSGAKIAVYIQFFDFCYRYSCLIDWCAESFSYKGVIGYLSSLIWNQPQRALFFAYFPHEERPDSRDILYLICCPSQLKEKVRAEITNQANAPTSSDSDSHSTLSSFFAWCRA